MVGELMIQDAIYVSGDNSYLWTGHWLKPIGPESREWDFSPLKLASCNIDYPISVLMVHQ